MQAHMHTHVCTHILKQRLSFTSPNVTYEKVYTYVHLLIAGNHTDSMILDNKILLVIHSFWTTVGCAVLFRLLHTSTKCPSFV